MATALVGSKRPLNAVSGLAVASPRPQKHLAVDSNISSRSSSASQFTYRQPEVTSAYLHTDQHQETNRHHPNSFAPEASLVLVGARGTGKSSLGVIAATTFHRRLIETDFAFLQVTGHSTTDYRRIHGSAEYQRTSLEVLDSILRKHATRSVIVCGLLTLTTEAQLRISQYAATHPVVHVLRDVHSVQQYLGSEESRAQDMLRTAEHLYRRCSNLEYYNISTYSRSPRSSASLSDYMDVVGSSSPHLMLKKAERCFLKFLALATNIHDSPVMDKVFPLSQIPLEARSHTYALRLPIEALKGNDFDAEKLEEGIDAFEVELEEGKETRTEISRNVSELRRRTIVPLIFHVAKSDSQFSDVSRYLELIHHGLTLSPEYMTLDLSLPDEILTPILQARGRTKFIGHQYTDHQSFLSWSNVCWVTAYQRAQTLGFQLVRFCWPAQNLEDNFRVQDLRSKIEQLSGPSLPLIAYNTGSYGRVSSCFNPILQPVMQQDFSPQRQRPEDPTITAIDATKALFAAFIFEPLNFYILGASSAYSLSPAMHNAAYQVCGMFHSYKTFQTNDLNELRTLINDTNFGGCSISLPFKLEVIDLMDSTSVHAKAIGAVNTVIALRETTMAANGGALTTTASLTTPDNVAFFRSRNRAGPVKALYGENTDWIGIRACVRRGLSPANAISPTKTTMLNIGAGGMSRAAIYAMLQLGVRNIVIYNRTKANADSLIAHFQRLLEDGNGSLFSSSLDRSSPSQLPPIRFHALTSLSDPWPSSMPQPTIIISCIPTHSLGSAPSPNFTMPPKWLQSPTGGVVMEVAYRNIRTPLLEQIRSLAARGQGWVTMDGLDLLPEQAFAQFELFTGRRAPRRLMRMEVLKGYRDEEGRVDPEIIERRLAVVSDQDP